MNCSRIKEIKLCNKDYSDFILKQQTHIQEYVTTGPESYMEQRSRRCENQSTHDSHRW